MLGGAASVAWLRVRWSKLRLASKFNLTLAGVGIVSLLLAGLALNQTIRPAFDGLERVSIEQQVERGRALQKARLAQIESATKDYAVWDDSYEYIATHDAAFEMETLTSLAVTNVDVNGIAYGRFDGEWVNSIFVEADSGNEVPALNTEFVELVQSERFVARARSQPSASEFAVLGGRLFAIGVAQIVRSDGSGTPAGYVAMARELSDVEAGAALQASVDVSTDIDAPLLVDEYDIWRVSVPIVSSGGLSLGSISFDMPRDISALGSSTILASLAATAVAIISVLTAVYFIVGTIVVRRLGAIDSHMQNVTASGILAPLAADNNGDELGGVGQSFNSMLAELKELREQIEVQSYQLGQSESAAGAMHNVRNSLNPVTVILSQALAEQAAVSAQNLEQALRELSSGDTVPARRERLAAFLQATFADLDRRAAVRREAFMTAKASLAEALEILRSQSDTAHKEIPLERFDILDVIRRNAKLNRFAPWGEVDIALPEQGVFVRANRLLMSQVIGNLMTNAIESIVAADRRPGHLVISIARAREADADIALVTVMDDGQGFAPEMAAKLFERGHSSKTNRSGGLGLHWCANTISAMGGSLSLESAGPGKGACATIRLRADSIAAVQSDMPARAA